MIFKMLIAGVMQLVTALMTTIMSSIPNVEVLTTDMLTIYTQIIGISQQALNFVHFIVGDSLIYILGIIPPLLAYKYLFLPVVDIARRCVPLLNL